MSAMPRNSASPNPRVVPAGEGLSVLDHRLGVGLEARLERFAERDGLGGDDVHEGAALKAGEDGRIDLLRNGLVVG